MRTRAVSGIVTGLFVFVASPAVAQRFDVVDLGTLGGASSRANDISENGMIAGWATTSPGVKHAVLWKASGIVDLGAPSGFIVAEAVAVNDAGQVAAFGEGNPQSYQAYLWQDGGWAPTGLLPGTSDSIAWDIDSAGRIAGESFVLGPGGLDRAIIWDAGVLTDLGTLGGYSRAFGMNDFGQVIGVSLADLPTGEQRARAFLWENGRTIALDPLPGDVESQAFDVNDAGEIAGSSWTFTTQNFTVDQATLWRNEGAEIVDLGLVPAPVGSCSPASSFWPKSIARALNNNGRIVGEAMCITSGSSRAAFLWENGVMHNLNDLIPAGSNWNLLAARAINDAGQIVGHGTAPNGELHAFLLHPRDVPPPCLCELDGDHAQVDVFDLLAYLNLWFPHDPAADVDGVAGVDVFDLLTFLSCWFPASAAGACP